MAQTKHLTAQGQREVEPRPILGTAASSEERATVWAAWEKRGEELLELQAARSEQADHACRLARAQWRRGKPFTLKVPPGVRRESLAELRKHTVKSSGAQLLFRKKGLITNLTDTERYYMANPGKGAARTVASFTEADRPGQPRAAGVRRAGPRRGPGGARPGGRGAAGETFLPPWKAWLLGFVGN